MAHVDSPNPSPLIVVVDQTFSSRFDRAVVGCQAFAYGVESQLNAWVLSVWMFRKFPDRLQMEGLFLIFVGHI